MFNKKSFSRGVRRLFQSSILIGLTMALVITPPVVVELFAYDNRADCEAAAREWLEGKEKSASEARQIRYDAANKNYKNTFDTSLDQYGRDCDGCAADLDSALTSDQVVYGGMMVACMSTAAVPWEAAICLGVATATFNYLVASADSQANSCLKKAADDHNARVNLAEKIRKNAIDEANLLYKNTMDEVGEDFKRWMRGCADDFPDGDGA